jgi:signal transduction histidine kinase
MPALRLHLARGARLLGFALAGSTCLGTLLDMLVGRVVVWRQAVLTSAWLFALLLIWRTVRTPAHARRPEGAIFGFAAVTTMLICLGGWASRTGVCDGLEYLFILPIGLAAFSPWQPTYTLGLGALLLCATGMVTASGAAGLSVPPWRVIEMMVVSSAAGAVANQLQRQLWQALEEGRRQMAALDRIAGLGMLAAGLAHEVKTPVAATMNSLDTARRLVNELTESIGHAEVTQDDLREIAGELKTTVQDATLSTERVGQIIRRVREHTRGLHATSSAEFGVIDRVRAIESLVSHQVVRAHGSIDHSGVSAEATVHGDVGKFDQILLNLIMNAIEAGAPAGKGPSIRLGTANDADGTLVVFVQDNGPGIAPEARARLFEPMFTTKATGTGLGLAISRELAEGAFGGSLELVPTTVGARFELRCGAAVPAQSRSAFIPTAVAA